MTRYKKGKNIEKISIGIDIGDTLTSRFFRRTGTEVKVKVATIRNVPSRGFLDCIAEGAAGLSLSLQEILRTTEAIRYSTILLRHGGSIYLKGGPKLGLLVTKGLEESFYADLVKSH